MISCTALKCLLLLFSDGETNRSGMTAMERYFVSHSSSQKGGHNIIQRSTKESQQEDRGENRVKRNATKNLTWNFTEANG